MAAAFGLIKQIKKNIEEKRAVNMDQYVKDFLKEDPPENYKQK